MAQNIAVIRGDGIGPEIVEQALLVLNRVAERFGHEFTYTDVDMGGNAIDKWGDPLPQEMLQRCLDSDSVLLGAVGGPKWNDTTPGAVRPEQGLLAIRKQLGLYLNLRPVRVYDALAQASSIKPELLKGVDVLIVRELTGGLYFGRHERNHDVPGAAMGGGAGDTALDSMEYSELEIERVVRWAFDAAERRRGHVTSVDKANVLETSRLWREVAHRVASEHPSVESEDMLVDNTAMQLVARPAQFDVMVTENTFGDILSDEASMLTGSLGMLASASLGDGTALYEPSHGSAPDIAGRGIANPIAQVLSVELMLRYSFGMDEAADALAGAVDDVLAAGWRTADIAEETTPEERRLSTSQMGDRLIEAFEARATRQGR